MVATYVLAAGESLNRPDESRLSSVRFLLSPLVWLRQPGVQLRCTLPRDEKRLLFGEKPY